MTQNGYLPGINVRILFKVIHRTAQPPCPGTDSTPFTGSRFSLTGFEKQLMDAFLERIREVRLDIAIPGGGYTVATGKDLFHGPATYPHASLIPGLFSTEERRVGKECFMTFKSRGVPDH